MNKRIVLISLAVMPVFSTGAFAMSNEEAGLGTGLGGSGEIILLAQIVLLLFVGRGLGEILQRIGQPAVVGQLLAGLILGPSLFGWLWPHAHDVIFPKTAEQKNLSPGWRRWAC